MTEIKRAAIYSIQRPDYSTGKYSLEDLVHCARYACRSGYRVVALAMDDADFRVGQGRARMQNLVDRMYRGEFDVIFVKSPISKIMGFHRSSDRVVDRGAVH